MSDLVTESIIYTLIKPIKYSTKAGGYEDANEITLIAPSAKDTAPCAALHQGFLRAARELQDDDDLMKAVEEARAQAAEDDEEKEKETQGDEIELPEPSVEEGAQYLMGVAMASKVDFGQYLDNFRKLLLGGRVALINGDIKMLPTHVDKLSYKDFEGLCGVYVRNFIEGSE